MVVVVATLAAWTAVAAAVWAPPREPTSVASCTVPRGAPRVVLFGDSLAYGARPRFKSDVECGARAHVNVIAQPGAALCDFRNVIRREVGVRRIDVAVIEFVGNNITPCTKEPTGAPLVGRALLARYRADAFDAMSMLTTAGAHVVFVTPLGRADTTEPPLGSVYEAVARAGGRRVSIVDGGREFRDSAGFYRALLPCLPKETSLPACSHGLIRVRMPFEGFHFCPVLKSGPCPVHAAGAVRFANEMTAGVEAVLRTRSAEARRHVSRSRRDRTGTRDDR